MHKRSLMIAASALVAVLGVVAYLTPAGNASSSRTGYHTAGELPANAQKTFDDLKLNVWGCSKHTFEFTTATADGRQLKPNTKWDEWTCMMSAQTREIATRSNIAHRWRVDIDSSGKAYVEYYVFSRWPNGDLNIGIGLGLYGTRSCKNGKLVLAGSVPSIRASLANNGESLSSDMITCSTNHGSL